MLAHELRNPLAPIANAAAVMRSAKADDAKVLRWASDIVGTQVEHMVRIVEDLLDVSRCRCPSSWVAPLKPAALT